MSLTGVDIAWSRPTVEQIKAVGAHFVARYFSTDPSKNLRASEVTAYKAAGLGTVVVWETTTGRARAGRAAGVADAQAAEVQRKAVGLPGDMVIHFAVDEDTTWDAVAPYFAGAVSVLGQPRVGVYGGFKVIEGAAAAGHKYLWQTTAWSAGRWSTHATIRQTGGTTLSGGADWDTATVPDFGQYPRPEVDMPTTPADAQLIANTLLATKLTSPFRKDSAGKPAQISVASYFEYLDAHYDSTMTAIAHLGGQVGALTAIVTKLAAGGGITAEQLQAAADAGGKAGAQAALAELGQALDGTKP